jgi:hypothetical protein
LTPNHKKKSSKRSPAALSADSGAMGLSSVGAPPLRGSKTKHVLINAFLIFHLVAIIFWAVPINTPLNQALKNLIRPYFIWSGLFQSWDMFSPSPKTVNSYVEAIVIYQDGTTNLWSFPRMELLSYSQRYAEERYRKYEESLTNDAFAPLWPDAARHVARLQNTHSSPPTKVMLVVRWSEIVLPTATHPYERGPWDMHVFYSYDVQPGDLQ